MPENNIINIQTARQAEGKNKSTQSCVKDKKEFARVRLNLRHLI